MIPREELERVVAEQKEREEPRRPWGAPKVKFGLLFASEKSLRRQRADLLAEMEATIKIDFSEAIPKWDALVKQIEEIDSHLQWRAANPRAAKINEALPAIWCASWSAGFALIGVSGAALGYWGNDRLAAFGWASGFFAGLIWRFLK